MIDKNEVILQVSKLHANGQLGEAHQVAQQAAQASPGDIELMNLLHMMRLEYMSTRQCELLTSTQAMIKRQDQTLAQIHIDKILSSEKLQDPLRLEKFGYTTASQNEEDGMLTEVFRRIGIKNKTFFEFGVGNGLQNNTLHFLMQGWRGWWIEINQAKVQFMRKHFFSALRTGQLTLGDTPVTAENINFLAEQLGVEPEIDLLSIDIDGNDYHVFEALECVNARVVVLEYNPVYPPPMEIVGAYDANYNWSADTYIGASLTSLTALAKKKGYTLVGCSIGGVNAIYVRDDLLEDKFSANSSAENHYHPERYQLSFSGGFVSTAKANFGPLHDENLND